MYIHNDIYIHNKRYAYIKNQKEHKDITFN